MYVYIYKYIIVIAVVVDRKRLINTSVRRNKRGVVCDIICVRVYKNTSEDGSVTFKR